MRSQCAIYVDAGYLIAASATRVTGTSLRSGVDVHHGQLINGLIEQAEADSGLPLLRVNWYDSGSRPGGLPDFVQDQIGLMPRVKLRLGRRSISGEQKGVDLRIGLDLATHGRQRVVDVMYLVSGDDDLTEAVEEAQSHGVQVQLLVVPDHADRPHAVARHLQRAADRVLLIDGANVDRAVRPRAIPEELLPHPEPEAPDTVPSPEPARAGAAEPAPPAAGESPASQGPDVPTPSVFAGKRSTVLVPPPPPASTVAWTSASGAPGHFGDVEDLTAEVIDAVARQVVDAWCASATPAMLADLKAGRPMIPGDLDRALLVDLSGRGHVYDVPDSARHALRDRFWFLVDRIRLA